MKLSTKFFCTAYVIVLLSVGIGGALLIHSVNGALIEESTKRVQASIRYASDVFCQYADVSSGDITPEQTENIMQRIKESYQVITDIRTVPTDEYPGISVNTAVSRLVKAPRSLTVESVT